MNISSQEKIIFVRHLAMLLKSGIPILEAMQILASQAKSSGWRKIITHIGSDIQNGQSLTKSLQKYPRIFDAFFIGIISVGEDSGTLDESLNYLHEHLVKSEALKRKVQNALTYPLLVVAAAFLTGFAVVVYLIPRLLTLFQGLSVPLPPITQYFIAIAGFIQNYGIALLVGIIGAIILYRLFLFFQFFRIVVDNIALRIPLLGPILQNIALTSLCRNIGVMMKSGLPITQSLRVAENMTDQMVFKKYVGLLYAAVEKGKSISQELDNRHFAFIPVLAIKMIAVGEKTGKLDETLLYLADFLKEKLMMQQKILLLFWSHYCFWLSAFL